MTVDTTFEIWKLSPSREHFFRLAASCLITDFSVWFGLI
ncbi:MAG: hypothetical protein J07HQW2_01473 [Haloquadratum walsbyi J07HQW2]|uniref:Uncharacterized protein n=1 Tax=Haloquadratum walsbyi J07HQW2 TaxID=1238425 RepID=U1MX49_9EURY|nr:MAG: hypothetical protein J07HQW2_01473 [Haloquadratum walsbyi J07HQW2]